MKGPSGRITYPLTVALVVGTTWCFAWARSVSDQSAKGYWPAKDPELMRRVLNGETEQPKIARPSPAAAEANPLIIP